MPGRDRQKKQQTFQLKAAKSQYFVRQELVQLKAE